jgi:hypothetical protein
VVNVQENGLVIAVPEVFCAPDTVAVYVIPAASELVGVNVATVLPLPKLTAPATELFAESFIVNDTEAGTTACENVTDGATDTATPDAPAAGDELDTTGGGATDDWEYTTSTQ